MNSDLNKNKFRKLIKQKLEVLRGQLNKFSCNYAVPAQPNPHVHRLKPYPDFLRFYNTFPKHDKDFSDLINQIIDYVLTDFDKFPDKFNMEWLSDPRCSNLINLPILKLLFLTDSFSQSHQHLGLKVSKHLYRGEVCREQPTTLIFWLLLSELRTLAVSTKDELFVDLYAAASAGLIGFQNGWIRNEEPHYMNSFLKGLRRHSRTELDELIRRVSFEFRSKPSAQEFGRMLLRMEKWVPKQQKLIQELLRPGKECTISATGQKYRNSDKNKTDIVLTRPINNKYVHCLNDKLSRLRIFA